MIDATSGQVISAVNPDARRYPASLTKMMTLYLLFDELRTGRLKLTSRLQVSTHAAAQAPSKLALAPGQTIAVEEVILALVTKSANDAAVVAAEAIGGSEANFAGLMTRRARQLGMRNTTFHNASGLPNLQQITTARDMATLARALVRDQGDYYHYFATRQFSWGGQVINSHNRVMLNYPGADGIKTGYIGASGFNLVASARRDGRRLIGVVFGGRTAGARDRQMVQLLDAGFARRGLAPAVMAAATPAADEVADPADEPDAAIPATEQVAEGDAGAVIAAMARTDAGHHGNTLAKPIKPVKASAGPAAARRWAIQVGVYHGRAPARSAAAAVTRSLHRLLARGEAQALRTQTRNGAIWRARVVGISESQARAACQDLSRKRKDCVVVKPSA